MRNRSSLLYAGLLAILAATLAAAQDPIRVAPKAYHLELENRWVRVLRLKLGPHENVPLHDEAESVVVFVSAAHERFSSPGKPKEELTQKAREVAQLARAKHKQ